MDLQKGYGCEVSWVTTNEFNSFGSPFSPPSQPPCQQQRQQKPNRNQQQQHQLHETFWMICLLEKYGFQVSRITLICIFSNKAKSSVLNKLINCLLCVAFFRKRWRAVRGPPPIIFYSLPYQSLLCMYSFPFEKGIRLEKQNSRYLGDNLCSKKQLWYLKFVLCINKLSFLFLLSALQTGYLVLRQRETCSKVIQKTAFVIKKSQQHAKVNFSIRNPKWNRNDLKIIDRIHSNKK